MATQPFNTVSASGKSSADDARSSNCIGKLSGATDHCTLTRENEQLGHDAEATSHCYDTILVLVLPGAVKPSTGAWCNEVGSPGLRSKRRAIRKGGQVQGACGHILLFFAKLLNFFAQHTYFFDQIHQKTYIIPAGIGI